VTFDGAQIELLIKAQSCGDIDSESSLIKQIIDKETSRKGTNQFSYKNKINFIMAHVAFGFSLCWYWIGSRDSGGYGIIGPRKAHRESYELFHGKIPIGMHVLHKCDIRSCINPDHLFLGTQLDNMRDCKRKGRIKPLMPRHGEENHMAKLTKEADSLIKV
jgi:hypothetical protein